MAKRARHVRVTNSAHLPSHALLPGSTSPPCAGPRSTVRNAAHHDRLAVPVLLHHVSRPGVEQEHEAAQGEVDHAAGGSHADADGVHAPATGGEAGDRGGADHAVRLPVARIPPSRPARDACRGSCRARRGRDSFLDRATPWR